MLELLFIIALVSWAAISLLQYLAGLAAAPSLLAAAIIVPVWALQRSRALARAGRIEFVRSARRRPLPPERFYWPSTRRWLGRRIAAAAVVAAIAWPVALLAPARLTLTGESMVGWASVCAGIAALTETAAGLWLYLKTSQRFNRQTPGLIGWLRRGLYRLSDNHEFLGEEPLPREKRRRESVY